VVDNKKQLIPELRDGHRYERIGINVNILVEFYVNLWEKGLRHSETFSKGSDLIDFGHI
jgi:hypothetical protein